MSRATGVDIITGEGLAEVVVVIIDVASWRASEQEATTEFFRGSARIPHEYGHEKAGIAGITVASGRRRPHPGPAHPARGLPHRGWPRNWST